MKKNAINDVSVGDIFVNTWGYDQTNVDFFQVIRKSKKCIFLRAINENKDYDINYQCGKKTPKKNDFITDKKSELKNDMVIKKTPYKYLDGCLMDKVYINFEYGCGQKWDGKPVCYSDYA